MAPAGCADGGSSSRGVSPTILFKRARADLPMAMRSACSSFSIPKRFKETKGDE